MVVIIDVLITGGAGFIGFHLARHLAQHNYDVTILDNFSRSKSDDEFKALTELKNVSFIRGDVTLADTFSSLDRGYDYVYHLAAINGTKNFYEIPDKVLRVGVIGTINVLDWFSSQKRGKILFTSSSETYASALKIMGKQFPIPTPESVPLVVDDPSNVRWCYGASKILGEVAFHSYAKTKNIRFSIIRYHNIYGPRMGFDHVIPQFIERIVKRQDPFMIFGGEETRTFCYVDDAVLATKLVMESEKTEGQTVHIGRSDGEIKIIELAKKLFDISGFHPKVSMQPAPEGSVMRRCPDTSRLKELGHDPRTSLDDGLKKTYHWYKDKF